MSVEMFAPAWYYVGDVNEEYQKRIEDLFKPFISNDDNFSDAVGWNCNVQTSFQHANNGSAPWTTRWTGVGHNMTSSWDWTSGSGSSTCGLVGMTGNGDASTY